MILKTWSGKISINGAEVEVKAVLTSDRSGSKEWHGSGSFSSFEEFRKLNETMLGTGECKTSIGSLFITNLSSNRTFTFQGMGQCLF